MIRRITHHPFDFLQQKISDPDDHRPIRLRYVGAFYVKPYWKKEMFSPKEALPEEGREIYVRANEKRFNKVYVNLKRGIVRGGTFTSDDSNVTCPVTELQLWRYAGTVVE